MAEGVPVVLSNIINGCIALIEQKPQLQTRNEILTFLRTVANEARSEEAIWAESQTRAAEFSKRLDH
jgi:hypothetical protein